jgi:branched-chain amino acid transport system substrate-binding protein
MKKTLHNLRSVTIAILCLPFCFPILGNGVAASESERPIVIGGTVSLEGKYREPSAMIQKAYEMWAAEVNQRGGLLGRQIKLILYDDKSEEKRAEALYRKLIEKDGVDLLLSPYSSPLTLAASAVSEQHQMLMLAVAAAANEPWQRGCRYLFQLYAPADRQFIGVLDMMARKNLRKVAVLYDAESVFNVDVADGVDNWSRTFKMTVVLRHGYRDGKMELPALLEKVRATAPDGLILSAYPPDAYEMLRLLEEMPYRPAVLAMPIVPSYPDFQEKVGAIASRVMGPSQWEPEERIPFPGRKEFVAAFSTYTGHMPSFHAASAYSACQLYEKAVVATNSLDNAKLRDYIAALNTVTVLGRFKVDGTGKQVGHNSFIIQWQKGKKKIVWPRKMRTAEPIL